MWPHYAIVNMPAIGATRRRAYPATTLPPTTPTPPRPILPHRKPPSHERPYPMANRNATDELGAIVLGAIILIVVLTLVIAGYSALQP